MTRQSRSARNGRSARLERESGSAGLRPVEGGDRKAFEATVPDSEAHTYWFVVSDVTSYEAVTRALEGLKAFVSFRQWQEGEGIL